MAEMNNNENDPTNGCGVVPPGFRFHPTEEELVGYYLTKRIHSMKIDLDVIVDIDLYNMEPWDIQDKCNNLGHCYDDEDDDRNEWYFFSHKDKKYPTGTRTNRATAAGFWKATGRDKAVHSKDSNMIIGMRKTLVFYKGRAPNGRKTDWIMHEYRLQSTLEAPPQEEGWVVCRAFKKPIPASNSNGPIRPILYSSSGGGYDEYPYWTAPPNHSHHHHHNMMSAAASTNPSSTSLIIIPELPNPLSTDDTNNNNIAGFPSPLPFMIRQQQQTDLITNYSPNSHHSRATATISKCNDGGGENRHYDQDDNGDDVIANTSWKFLDSLLGSNNNSITSTSNISCGNDILPDPTTFFLEQQQREQELPHLNYNDAVHEHEEDELDPTWK